ncbi:MAG: hypothetical protein QNK40_15770 [Desulfobacterales bacterium]|nr:hypothetical protein [Desulfobacterales bacterium]MDX2510304.1 hypothetical protein [Desulfobacterales bacterium]
MAQLFMVVKPQKDCFDLILLRRMEKEGLEIPVVVIARQAARFNTIDPSFIVL